MQAVGDAVLQIRESSFIRNQAAKDGHVVMTIKDDNGKLPR